MRRLAVAIAFLAACDGDAWSPRAERARAEEDRAIALAVHLETLPGVRDASVVLELPFADPLAPPSPAAPPRASIVLALEPGADPDAVEAAARDAVAGAIDGVAITVVSAAPAAEPRVADGRLRAALAGALVVIIGLALWIVAVYRRATKAQ